MSTIYEVIVGNIGTVHTGTDKRAAELCFKTYVDRSYSGYGRCANESVCLMADDEPVLEYEGKASNLNDLA